MAAGLGTRLRPLTLQMPKPLVPVLNRPIMEHIVRHLASHSLETQIANLSYLPEQIRDHFGDGSDFGAELSFSEETELLGTAGGVRNVADFLTADGDFFVMAGDALTDIDLTAMRAFHDSHDGVATLAVKKVSDTTQYGVVIHGADGRVQGFQEKPAAAEALSDLASCMIYMLRREIFDYFPEDPVVDFATDVFPALLEHDVPFYVHEIDDYWNDVGNLHEFLQGNFDALAGAVTLQPGEGSEMLGEEAGPGPILAGAGCQIAGDAWLHGPLVLGDNVTIGAGSQARESVFLDGGELAAGTFAGRAVLGPRRG